jgi:hypothetical protein
VATTEIKKVIKGLVFLGVPATAAWVGFLAYSDSISPEGRARAARESQEATDKVAIDIAEMLVRNRLRDPDSAQFLRSRVVRKDGKEAVCGFVNAKNGFGGMAGNEWFTVVESEPLLAGDGQAAFDQINHFCGGAA